MKANAVTPIIQQNEEHKLRNIDVPSVLPSRFGLLTTSCTRILLNPSCIIGRTNATRDDAYVINPKYDGPKYRAVNMFMIKANTD
jgi:hypothetical protein